MDDMADWSGNPAWRDWTWQQRHCVRTSTQLRSYFPRCPEEILLAIDRHNATRRFQLTPYYLRLIETRDGAPVADDPLWRQVVPELAADHDRYSYDSETENWEHELEMVTPIAQNKYGSRVILRLSNVCHAYCQFCYEALRTLEKDSRKDSFDRRHWAATLRYLAGHEEVDEVILSGGEPLMHADRRLDEVLGDLRAVGEDLIVRIHTRSLTFNPYRITDDLVRILRDRNVQAVGLHVSHVREVSADFADAVRRLQQAVPILFANIPLLGGINCSAEAIRSMCLALYRLGVHAGYLYHFMPYSPGGHTFRVPIATGTEIMRSLRRRLPSPAMPEYVLPHVTGKYTVPLTALDEFPRHEVDDAGVRTYTFVDWRGNLATFPDPL